MPEDPWSGLNASNEHSAIKARRVDASGPWDFYWARDSDGRCLLVMRHAPESSPRNRLPKLRGVDVFAQPAYRAEGPSLVLRLLDGALRDIFLRLCIDIIESASRLPSEPEAVATAVARTWRWHHLLRGGGSSQLSTEEQKGLIGELLVLERYMLASLSASDAVGAWCGPLGAPQDFVVGMVAIESKARAVNSDVIPISSEYQLDDTDRSALFLHLTVLNGAKQDDADAFTVTDVARRIKDRLVEAGENVTGRYEALLAAAGFRYEDDYSSTRWTGGERSIYRVDGSFPRLIPGNLAIGLAGVKYTVSVAHCGPHVVSPSALTKAIASGGHGN